MNPVRLFILTFFLFNIFGWSYLTGETRIATAGTDTNNLAYNGDPNVQVISPNGGETLSAGSTFEISWTSANLNENVKIELSVDGGKTWDAVAADAENTGRYIWDVPDRPTTDARIRLSGSPTISVYDTSDTSFTISGSSLIYNRIEEVETTLAGGYVVEDRLETSNGKVARLATTGTGTMTYTFDLPPADYELFVRYLDENDGICTSVININGNKVAEWVWDLAVESDIYHYRRIGTFRFNANDEIEMWTMRDGGEYGRIDYFEFVQPNEQVPAITVLSPNGGENWPIDSAQEITWIAENTSGRYTIQLSRDAGTSWEDLATNTEINPAADSTLSLVLAKVSGPISDSCLVKVSDANGSASDVSAAFFSITESQTPKLTLTSPNGGEIWMTGTLETITWSSRNANGPIKIELSRNTGATWETLLDNTPNDGTFDWTVTIPPSDNCLIRITDTITAASDTSDGIFIIKGTPKLTLIMPNGGESWDVGTIQRIRWASEFVIGNIKLDLSRDAGNSWESITADTLNKGTYSWSVKGPETQSALVALSALDGSAADTSDAAFTIITPPSITVTSPNGGEMWQIGETHTITWQSYKIDGNVKIEISRDAGQSWSVISASVSNVGFLEWTVTGPASTTALIKISSSNGSVSGTSDSTFSIHEPPQIVLTSPNGGEKWTIGTMQKITWTSVNTSGFVNVELSRDGGTNWQALTNNTEDTGELEWLVTVPASPSCRIRISDVSGTPFDVSDTDFAIVQPLEPTLTLIKPNGGETWAIGTSQKITWFSQDIETDITIDLSRDNGSTWETLGETVIDSSSFTWNVTAPAADSALVRLSTNSGAIQTKSAAIFTISEQPVMTITAPNGGEKWHIGERRSIEWTSVNTSGAVKIQISRDNGDTWETLIENVADTGSTEWTVTGPASNICLIMISDVDGSPIDISNAVFSVLEEPSISLISPNGDEIWRIGETNRIVWESTYGGAMINIELSRDFGASWQALIPDAPNSGSWMWTVTGPPNESCLIRITDIQNAISDTSEAPFKIDYPTGIARIGSDIPNEYALLQNYPNPFNPITRIQYQLPSRSAVRLEVYSSLGNLIATLVDEVQAAGVYMLIWSGVDAQGHHMPSGVYFYRISADGFSATRRMMLIK
ncbi:T9SS C-terminal target domain-containing protein [candidate division KSB1 bacterium]|nr:T9SS type A sorting domain-containing protein [candidate division KSB1 bacterium]RQW04369.1 MAG: T9SS C-terminal target domain-containing protein [candidate division KSB1 bacterium]